MLLLVLLAILLTPIFNNSRVAKVKATNLTSAINISCGKWNIIPSPNVPNYNSTLSGVIALSTTNAWVVGNATKNDASISLTLIEHWNGTKWSITPSPTPSGATYGYLNAISASSANNVWAVGDTFYLPSGKNSYYQTLIEHWNGTKWSIVASPNPGAMTSILSRIVVLSQKNAWAVGYYQNPTITDGGDNHALIEHWDGTSWSITSLPNTENTTSQLTDIVSTSANNIWAVGYITDNTTNLTQALLEHWDGTQWSTIPGPHLGTSSEFSSAVVLSPTTIRVFGTYQPNTNNSSSFVAQWNGTSWRILSGLIIAKSNTQINGTVAVSENNMWAAGYVDNSSVVDRTLTEQWNGSRWSIVSSPNVGKYRNRLNAIAHIPGTNQLWASGFTMTNTRNQTLIEFCS